MTPTDQALAALSGWPNAGPIHSHPGAWAARYDDGASMRVLLRFDPDRVWRCHVRSGELSLGFGVATTPEAALEHATTAAKDRLGVLASLLV